MEEVKSERKDEKLKKDLGVPQGEKIRWYNPKESPFQLSGFAWFQQEKLYRRLPKELMVGFPKRVNELANCTSGGQIRFKTNSKKLKVKVKLSGKASMGHMPATGQCGFDIYIGAPGKQQYMKTAIPSLNENVYESALMDSTGTFSEMREITMNFPLYQGVEEVLIGLEHGSSVGVPTPYLSDKKILLYGTSITQGACASRPGMSYTNILSRRFQLEFINLGFSGSGKGEKEVALTIREIEKPACLVIDYEANVTAKQYEATLVPFIELYREYHPLVPIIVMSRIPYTSDMNSLKNEEFMKRRDHSQFTVAEFQRSGDQRITFIDGLRLLGEKWHECTVEGVHPNDFGFMKMADGIEGVLRSSLNLNGKF
ncbi:hypothetical protein F3157_01610 [Virgibacillus dakarensis]|nr:hypothetical protein [Virgibacillus dakarensis]